MRMMIRRRKISRKGKELVTTKEKDGAEDGERRKEGRKMIQEGNVQSEGRRGRRRKIKCGERG